VQALQAVRASYAEKLGDEFVLPTVIVDGDAPVGTVRDGGGHLLQLPPTGRAVDRASPPGLP
jgi:bisphosphoglycerate-independent phosphoglycerate mutase (AlkP superfamily)